MMEKTFIARRRINWLSLAFLYGSFYALRYNISLANKPIRDEFGFSKSEFGMILTATYVAYALGQFINGPIVDAFGGKRTMAVGALGTILANILFGLNAYTGLLNLFVAVWVLNGYMQSFGSPGNHRINCHWFRVEERGVFSGIFSAVVYMGRFFIMLVGPLIIAHCHWKWVFILPAILACAVVAAMYALVEERPEDVGFAIDFAESKLKTGEEVNFFTSLKIVLRSKVLWIMGLAYFSTGVVRNGLEQWFPSYLQEVHRIPLGSIEFGAQAILMPIAALAGAIAAGFLSDRVFHSRRGPVVAIMYFAQALLLVLFTLAINPAWCGAILIALSFMFSGPHSLMGNAATLDFGGREAVGAATGFFDAMQYFGASLVGIGMGKLIDLCGWRAWGPSLILFTLSGGILMCLVWREGGVQKERR